MVRFVSLFDISGTHNKLIGHLLIPAEEIRFLNTWLKELLTIWTAYADDFYLVWPLGVDYLAGRYQNPRPDQSRLLGLQPTVMNHAFLSPPERI